LKRRSNLRDNKKEKDKVAAAAEAKRKNSVTASASRKKPVTAETPRGGQQGSDDVDEVCDCVLCQTTYTLFFKYFCGQSHTNTQTMHIKSFLHKSTTDHCRGGRGVG
jgi:hypothetical protein